MRKLLLASAVAVWALPCAAQTPAASAAPSGLELPGVGAPFAPVTAQAPRSGPQALSAMPSDMVAVGPGVRSRAVEAPPVVPAGPGYVAGGYPAGYIPPGYAAPMPGYAPVPPGYGVPAYVPTSPYAPGYAPPGYVPGTPYAPPADGPPVGPPTADQMNPRDGAFWAAMQSLMPTTLPQERSYRRAQAERDRAGTEPRLGAPQATTRSIRVNLRPGEAQPMLHLFGGNGSTVTFADANGVPWPVEDAAIGNPHDFAVQEFGEKGKTNTILVSPKVNYGSSANLQVKLANLAIPVSFTVDIGSGSVDYRLDVNVAGRSPNAHYAVPVSTVTALQPTDDRALQAFVDGTPPRGARAVKTSARDVEAWTFNDMLYVRSSLELMSPPYTARRDHVSGMHVFRISEMGALVFSRDGRLSQVTLDR